MTGAPGRAHLRRGVAEAGVLIVVALVLSALLGAANPVPRLGVSTDRLGPDNGEPVADYIARAELSVADAVSDALPRWALVSFVSSVSSQQSFDVAGTVRVAQVLLRVPTEGVQTPVIAVGVPGTRESVLGSPDVAATRLRGGDGQSRTDAASVMSLAAGCDCVVGLVVRAPGDDLRSISANPLVRAVEALPSDAIGGRFAVRSLLPDHVDVVGPLAENGPIPPR